MNAIQVLDTHKATQRKLHSKRLVSAPINFIETVDLAQLVTMDDDRRRIPDGGLYIEDNVIRQVGPSRDLPPVAGRFLSALPLPVDARAASTGSRISRPG